MVLGPCGLGAWSVSHHRFAAVLHALGEICAKALRNFLVFKSLMLRSNNDWLNCPPPSFYFLG